MQCTFLANEDITLVLKPEKDWERALLKELEAGKINVNIISQPTNVMGSSMTEGLVLTNKGDGD